MKKEDLSNFVTKQDLQDAMILQDKKFDDKLEKRFEAQTQELLRHMGAYKEELSSQVRQIAEQFVDFDRRLNLITEDIKEIKYELIKKVDYKEYSIFKKKVTAKIKL